MQDVTVTYPGPAKAVSVCGQVIDKGQSGQFDLDTAASLLEQGWEASASVTSKVAKHVAQNADTAGEPAPSEPPTATTPDEPSDTQED